MAAKPWITWPLLVALYLGMGWFVSVQCVYVLALAQVICFFLLTQPEPLSESDVSFIATMLNDYPHWEERIARWMAAGPLDQRHFMTLSYAWSQAQTLLKQAPNTASPEDIQRSMGRISKGRLSARAEEIRLERQTPAVATLAPPTPNRRL